MMTYNLECQHCGFEIGYEYCVERCLVKWLDGGENFDGEYVRHWGIGLFRCPSCGGTFEMSVSD